MSSQMTSDSVELARQMKSSLATMVLLAPGPRPPGMGVGLFLTPQLTVFCVVQVVRLCLAAPGRDDPGQGGGSEGFEPNLRPGLRFQFLKGLSVCSDFK